MNMSAYDKWRLTPPENYGRDPADYLADEMNDVADDEDEMADVCVDVFEAGDQNDPAPLRTALRLLYDERPDADQRAITILRRLVLDAVKRRAEKRLEERGCDDRYDGY